MKKQSTPFIRQKKFILFVGLLITFSISLLFISMPNILQDNDGSIYDIYLRMNKGGKPSETPAIVDIDEASLAEYGQWPWPRHLVAKLVKALTENGAAAIGLDIMFVEPDKSSPVIIEKSLKDNFNVDIDFLGLPNYLKDNDVLLSTIIRQSPTVLGFYVSFNKDNTQEQGAASIPTNLPIFEGVVDRMTDRSLNPRNKLIEGSGITLPLEMYYTTTPIGSLNAAPDRDGIIRSLPLITKVGDRVFLSLALRSLMRGLNINTYVLESGFYGLEAINIGKYRIPVTPSGLFHIPFRGPKKTYPYFSAKDILEGKIPASELQGRILFVGTSATGLLDIRATPLDLIYPGVETHAAVIDGILSGKAIHIPAWTLPAQLAIIFTIGIITTFVFGLAPAFVYLPTFLIFSSLSIYSSWHLFTKGTYISPQYALITIFITMLVLVAIRFWQENLQKRQLRKAFSRYVAPEMVKQIADRGEAVLNGEEREVTLIFTDIRGFTNISEKVNPAEIVKILNSYFTPMTKLIRDTGGTVDKFIGDAIMAFWNAPLDVKNHPMKALQTSINMQKSLKELNLILEEKHQVQINMGAGLHTGKVYVGNMGSDELLDYTCIGDTVNLTSRLESLCSTYGVTTILSKDTVDLCLEIQKKNDHSEELQTISVFDGTKESTVADIILFSLDTIKVKGKNQAIEVYIALDSSEVSEIFIELKDFYEAKKLYFEGNFQKSRILFENLVSTGTYKKCYNVFLFRTSTYCENPPSNWDGVWTYQSK